MDAHVFEGRVTTDGRPCQVVDCPCGCGPDNCAVFCSCGWSCSHNNDRRTDDGDKVAWLMHVTAAAQAADD